MDPVDFARDSLGADLLPVGVLADCAGTVLAADGRTLLSYGAAAGYTPLRELIAQWFGVHPYRVVLTNGWLHGLVLLAESRARGRNVLVEYPIHDRAERVFLRAGASLVGVELDELGFGVEQLPNLFAQHSRPALVYTIPTFHNPTGATTTVDRRRLLVEAIAGQKYLPHREQSLLVENDAYGLTRFEGDALPGLFDLSGRQSVYGSSFSTLLGPGLRVGWWILPEQIAGAFAEAAASTYITPVLAAQATVFEFLHRGAFEPHLAVLREALRARRDALVAAILRNLPDARFELPEGGFFLWLQLPHDVDGRAVLERAEGVTARAGTAFGSKSHFLRLCFAGEPPDRIDAGIERLAAAL